MKTRHGRTGFVRLVRRIRRDYRIHKSWRAIGALYGVSSATARRVSMGYEPRLPDIRRALGLSIHILITACPKCGKRHDEYKVCPDKRKRRILNDLPLADRPVALLAWQIANRHE